MFATEVSLNANVWFTLLILVVVVGGFVFLVKTGGSIRSSILQIESKTETDKEEIKVSLGTPNGKGNLTNMSETVIFQLNALHDRFGEITEKLSDTEQTLKLHTNGLNKLTADMSTLSELACGHYTTMNDHLAAHQRTSDRIIAIDENLKKTL